MISLRTVRIVTSLVPEKEMQKERMFLSYFFSATSQEGNSLGAM